MEGVGDADAHESHAPRVENSVKRIVKFGQKALLISICGEVLDNYPMKFAVEIILNRALIHNKLRFPIKSDPG